MVVGTPVLRKSKRLIESILKVSSANWIWLKVPLIAWKIFSEQNTFSDNESISVFDAILKLVENYFLVIGIQCKS